MIGPEVTAPDLTEAVIGYRQFDLKRGTQHNYKLCSPHAGTPWDKPEMRAVCTVEIKVPEGIVLPHPPRPHSAPAKDCGCGVYAYFNPCPVWKREADHYRYQMGPIPQRIEALMTLEGRIEVHDRGMRAATARIRAVGLNDNLDQDELVALREITSRWKVPLVGQDDLPTLAPEYGRSLGKELRPSPPELPEAIPPTPYPVPTFEAMLHASTPRPSRTRWVPAGANAAMAMTNAGFFFAFGSWVCAGCAAASAAWAFYLRPKTA